MEGIFEKKTGNTAARKYRNKIIHSKPASVLYPLLQSCTRLFTKPHFFHKKQTASFPKNRGKRMRSEYPHRNQKPSSFDEGFIGAATRIRTGDLILTKDVLYQLSHSSVFVSTYDIIPECRAFVKRKFYFFEKYFPPPVRSEAVFRMPGGRAAYACCPQISSTKFSPSSSVQSGTTG